MRKQILFIGFLLMSIAMNAQEKWEFANATPYETVKSHFYFLEKGHYNIELATYTLGEVKLSTKAKESNLIKLKSILLSLNLKIEDVLNRKRGIKEKNKYQLTSKEPLVYLIRVKRKWIYSPETIKNIPNLYKNHVLNISPVKQQKGRSDSDLIKELIKNDSTGIKFSLITPAKTISSHLLFLGDSLFNPELASLTINFAPEDTSDAKELAIKLKQIYLGAERKVFLFNELSTDTFYTDSASGKHIFFPNEAFRELYLEKIGDKWLYSRSTSKLIRSVHEDMYGNDAEEVFHFSDKFKVWAGVNSNNIVLKILKLWQVYMIFYFFIIFIALQFINRTALKLVFKKLLARSPYREPSYHIIASISYIVLFSIIKNYAPSFELPMDYNHILLKIIKVFLIFYYTLLAVYSVNFFKVLFTHGRSYDSQFGIVVFASLIIKSIIFITSMLFVIDALDFNLFNFLAGLSIGGFALALGAQDTVKNFLGSLMIFADKSFRVGDWIDNGEISGTVEEIGLRSTKVRTFHNSLVTVPNSLLSDNNIDNLGRRAYRRYKSTIVVKYNTPSNLIDEFTQQISELIEKHPDTRKDFYMVYINDFGSYGVKVLIYAFFVVDDWKNEMKARHELIKSILDLRDELGIEFSVPTIAQTEDS
ncbi:MAG: mechanosensitive ion channel family protein [Bacteroidales bacterium]|nr:mechanosensitive ion channel family protein [Bacteroidales bacterium]